MFSEDAELSLLNVDLTATADVAGHRLIAMSGDYPVPGGFSFGVTRAAMAEGTAGTIDVIAAAKVEAGASFARDVPLMAGVSGTVIAHDGDGDNIPIGRSLAAAEAGDVVSVFLIPCAGVRVNAA